ncbi:MAG: hypothetical protein AB4352_19090 [Hormoscilla sp.]
MQEQSGTRHQLIYSHTEAVQMPITGDRPPVPGQGLMNATGVLRS